MLGNALEIQIIYWKANAHKRQQLTMSQVLTH